MSMSPSQYDSVKIWSMLRRPERARRPKFGQSRKKIEKGDDDEGGKSTARPWSSKHTHQVLKVPHASTRSAHLSFLSLSLSPFYSCPLSTSTWTSTTSSTTSYSTHLIRLFPVVASQSHAVLTFSSRGRDGKEKERESVRQLAVLLLIITYNFFQTHAARRRYV